LHGFSRKHRFQHTSIAACVSVAVETCLPSRCLATALHSTISSRLNMCSFCGAGNL
jgi:hypothetical protein